MKDCDKHVQPSRHEGHITLAEGLCFGILFSQPISSGHMSNRRIGKMVLW